MTKRTFTGKGGETWEWEETPEVTEALKKLHRASVDARVKRPHNLSLIHISEPTRPY